MNQEDYETTHELTTELIEERLENGVNPETLHNAIVDALHNMEIA